jgi:hypothetical protein
MRLSCLPEPARSRFTTGWHQRLMPLLALAGSLTGCSPALDWRTVSPSEAPGLTMAFPCKPEVLSRPQALASLGPRPVPLTQWQCEADGIRWSLMRAQADTPETRLQLLRALREGLGRNMSPPEGRPARLQRVGDLTHPAGRTPHPDEGQYLIEGHLPRIDAPPAPMHAVLWQFSKGMDVYQLGAWHPTLQPGDPRLAAFSEGVNFGD